jgi:hypothetical protein
MDLPAYYQESLDALLIGWETALSTQQMFEQSMCHFFNVTAFA